MSCEQGRAPTSPLPEAERDGNVGLAGHLNVVWMEDFETGRTDLRYYLTTGTGEVVHLKDFQRMVAGRDPSLLAGQRVSVRGETDPDGAMLVEAVEWSSRSVDLHAVEEQSGSNPHVNILCKFPDSDATPFTVGEVADLFASTSPGLDHFWSALSYGIFDLSGSTAHGWYTLPHPQDHYTHENGTFKPEELLQDCTAEADDDVHFPSFSGINLFFNEEIGNTWSTLGTWTLTLEDGVERPYGVLWMPPSANHARVAHGIGHTFGLLHSGTESGGEFANLYDLMSADPCAAPGSGLYSFVGHHMIAEYKRRLGWLGGRVHQASGVLVEDILLERLATPAGGGPLAVEIPTATDRYYTLENRQVVEYDEGLGCREPGVILHVVDSGNTWWVRNDAGSDRLAFQPGESFRLEDAGVEVRVGADDGSEIQVSIHPAGPTEVPQNLTAQRVDSSRIKLAWEMPDGALGHSEFRIFRRQGTSGPFVYIRRVLGDKSSFVDSGLAERTLYEYIIRACNFETCSKHSNRASAITGPPITPPSDVAASAVSHSRIYLTWDHSDPPDTFTEFRIFRRAKGETSFAYLRRVLSDKRSYVDDDELDPSTGYEYFLRACDSDAGICSSASSVVSAETAAAIDPPENLSAQTVDSSRIRLTWDHPESSTVSPTEYRIFRRTGTEDYAFVRRVLADKDSYVDSGLSPATDYDYFLRACTSDQCSLPSNEAAAATEP